MPQNESPRGSNGETFVAGRGQLPLLLAQGLNQSHLPSLDGLRAVAVSLVVFYHMKVRGVNGGMGVLIFFVLSGFLITWLLLKEEERFGKISLKAFYLRRTLRIFPAFYVYWFLLVGSLLVFSKRLVIGQAICSFLYLNNYYQAIFGDPNTGLSHTWSLGIEEQFYLLWPLTFLMLKDNRRRLQFLWVAISAVWLYRELLVFVWHAQQSYIYEAFDTRADHLMIGCLLAVALREGVWIKFWNFLVSSVSSVWVTLGCLVASSVANYHFGVHYRDPVSFIVDPVLTAVLMVQLIAHRAGAMGTVLNWRPIRYLGLISYSIYLYHQITIQAVYKLTRNWPLLSPLVAILTTIAVASASYWLIEWPILRLKARFSPTKPRASVTEVQNRESLLPAPGVPVPASAFSSSNLVTESMAEAKK
jgi:peptidoglycan/LPS O-acetylase OafA/YrhL